MKITVEVKLRAPEPKLEPQTGIHFIAWLTAEPENNQANKQLIKLLAGYFEVPVGDIKIMSGLKSNVKQVEVLGIDTRA